MRKTLLALLAAGFLWTTGANATGELVTGDDWMHNMSAREKYMSLVPPTLVFSDYDVHMKLSLPQYIFLIDRIMQRNPGFADEGITNIFASAIYLFEPQNREALRSMEMHFLQGDYNFVPPQTPRLTIDELLRESGPCQEMEPATSS